MADDEKDYYLGKINNLPTADDQVLEDAEKYSSSFQGSAAQRELEWRRNAQTRASASGGNYVSPPSPSSRSASSSSASLELTTFEKILGMGFVGGGIGYGLYKYFGATEEEKAQRRETVQKNIEEKKAEERRRESPKDKQVRVQQEERGDYLTTIKKSFERTMKCIENGNSDCGINYRGVGLTKQGKIAVSEIEREIKNTSITKPDARRWTYRAFDIAIGMYRKSPNYYLMDLNQNDFYGICAWILRGYEGKLQEEQRKSPRKTQSLQSPGESYSDTAKRWFGSAFESGKQLAAGAYVTGKQLASGAQDAATQVYKKAEEVVSSKGSTSSTKPSPHLPTIFSAVEPSEDSGCAYYKEPPDFQSNNRAYVSNLSEWFDRTKNSMGLADRSCIYDELKEMSYGSNASRQCRDIGGTLSPNRRRMGPNRWADKAKDEAFSRFWKGRMTQGDLREVLGWVLRKYYEWNYKGMHSRENLEREINQASKVETPFTRRGFLMRIAKEGFRAIHNNAEVGITGALVGVAAVQLAGNFVKEARGEEKGFCSHQAHIPKEGDESSKKVIKG